MNRIVTVSLIILIGQPLLAQGIWKRISGIPSPRKNAVAFNIGDYGYVGTGDWGSAKNDLWRYNPKLDTWDEMASMPTPGRTAAIAFVIDGKAYIGGGLDEEVKICWDFWEYNPVNNEWKRKADMPTPNSYETGAGFSVGHRGYYLSTYHKETFFEYDPYSDSWTVKTEFPGVGRMHQAGFSIGNKGYIGSGYAGSANGGATNEFWEYDPIWDQWEKKADIPGTPRVEGVGFATVSKGYIGLGVAKGGKSLKDFWEYDPASEEWKQIDSINFTASYAVGFGIDDIGYIGSGLFTPGNVFWQYKPNNTSVGIQVQTNNLQIHPNPTSYYLFIESDEDKEIEFSVFTLQGKEVLSRTVSPQDVIDIKDITEGLFIIHISSGKEDCFQKIIVSR